MIRILVAFGIAFAICWFGIAGFRNLSGKDKWALTKLFGYSIICASLAVTLLTIIVVLF
jgi:hypothetical protein